MSPSVLQLESVELYREDSLIFKDVSFRLESSHHLVVRGKNGSGKTSLIRTICGLTQPDSGHISWNRVAIDQSFITYNQEMAYLGHKNGLIPELTLDESLNYGLYEANKEKQDEVIDGFGLNDSRGFLIENLSNGQARKAALSLVITSNTTLWVLDEPYANLDSDSIAYLNDSIGLHLDSGGIVITSTNREDSLSTKTTEIVMDSR